MSKKNPLRAMRKAAGLSIDDLLARTRYSRTTVEVYEAMRTPPNKAVAVYRAIVTGGDLPAHGQHGKMNALRAMREEAKLSLQQIMELTGYKPKTISAYETMENPPKRAVALYRAAINGEEPPPPYQPGDGATGRYTLTWEQSDRLRAVAVRSRLRPTDVVDELLNAEMERLVREEGDGDGD